MSELTAEHVEQLRRGYADFSRGDFDAALAEGVHPDVEFVPPSASEPIRGVERVRAWMEPDAFASQVAEPEEFRVSGNKILVSQRTRLRGAGSGIEVEARQWTLWTYEDGLIKRIEVFLPHQEAEALRAAGLPPAQS